MLLESEILGERVRTRNYEKTTSLLARNARAFPSCFYNYTNRKNVFHSLNIKIGQSSGQIVFWAVDFWKRAQTSNCL